MAKIDLVFTYANVITSFFTYAKMSSPSIPQSSIPQSSQLAKHLQTIKTCDTREKSLYLIDNNQEVYYGYFLLYDTIYFGDIEICIIYEHLDVKDYYPEVEAEIEREIESEEQYNKAHVEESYFVKYDRYREDFIREKYRKRLKGVCYYYNDEGNIQDMSSDSFKNSHSFSSYKYYMTHNVAINPELRPFSSSYCLVFQSFKKPEGRQKILELLKLCGNDLESICFENEYEKDDGTFNIEVLKCLPNLKKISIQYHSICGRYETQEEYKECVNWKPNHFKFLENTGNVKYVDISYYGNSDFKNIDGYVLKALSKNPHLEKLHLGSFDYISKQEIEMLVDSLPNLKDFYFSGECMNENLVEIILRKLKKLEKVSISSEKVSDEFIEKMRAEYPHVKIVKY